MSSSSSNNSTNGVETSMIPWLHFTGGDHLLFKSLTPSSKGAIAGACIVLVVLALFERWVAARRGVLEARWRKSALAMISGRSTFENLPQNTCDTETKSDTAITEIPSVSRTNSTSSEVSSATRTIPPFIASHDIPRGAIHALQALLGYALMLSVMTFQAAYLMSIVFGLGLGEVLFGRMAGSSRIH